MQFKITDDLLIFQRTKVFSLERDSFYVVATGSIEKLENLCNIGITSNEKGLIALTEFIMETVSRNLCLQNPPY